MAKIKNDNEYKIGDNVWWFDAWGNLRNGVIYNFVESQSGRAAAIHELMENGKTGASSGALAKNCWPSKEICLAKEKERSQAQVMEYKASIQSVHDLVKFMYVTTISGEDPDYDARRAVEERSAELGVPVREGNR